MKYAIWPFILISLIAGKVRGQIDTVRSKTVSEPPKTEIPALKWNFNTDGTQFFQVTFLNQAWARFNESNPGTTVEGDIKKQTFDIGLRRTRIQMYGQLTSRVFLYFQFGQNNFNSQSGLGNNRKNAVFFHDAVGEYRFTRNHALSIGGGLTITNGLSRFSQPSIGTIMTMDVPVFAQATVDATDQFSRKLSIYARGQIGKLDYRLILSDPFPVASNGQAAIPLSDQANFARKGQTKQVQTMLQYEFLDSENHQTPYMTGTYLGKKRVLNLGGGLIYQPRAMWKRGATEKDTLYQPMLLWATEVFYDAPVNKEKGTALSVYAGYFNYNFGTNYLRYNGIMNPANGVSAPAGMVSGSGGVYGNAHPMFGTGQAFYTQAGYLFKKDLLGAHGTLMPYASLTHAQWNRLQGKAMDIYNLGINWLINGHKAKISVDWQNRPVYSQEGNEVKVSGRRNQLVVQYQIFI